MKRYKTISAIELKSGLIVLNQEQAGKRQRSLVATETDGVYQIVSPVQFAKGEEIGLDLSDTWLLGKIEDINYETVIDRPKPGRRPKRPQ